MSNSERDNRTGPTDAVRAAALDIVPQAVLIADAGGRPLDMNRRARRLLGVSDEADPGAWSGRLPTLAREYQSDWVNLPLPDGTLAPFWFWARSLSPSAGDGGAVLYALWPCRLTEEQSGQGSGDGAAYDEMMAVMARHALLGEMGGALAHQMSQPLNIIRLTAERAALEAEDGTSATDSASAAERFARLADQAEALFETVSLVQGAPAIHGAADLEVVDIAAVINRAAVLARSPLRAAGLKAEVIAASDPPGVWGEPVLLLQVAFAVMTVLADALGGDADLEERPVRGGSVRSLIVRVDSDAAVVGDGRLSVDMARDDVVRLGLPLMPVVPDLSLSRRVVLAGLALAGLDGHLMMLVDDQGALRGARLDLARAGSGAGGDLSAGSDATERPDRDASGTGGIRVLLAEDEIEAATEIADFLREEGCGVTVAGDVAAALRALDQAQYDVLVSDVAMPGGNVGALLRAAEAAHPDLAIILASGFAVEGDATFGDLADMADAILRKPLSLNELYGTIRRVLTG
ncbi:PAS domain-containing protein [Rhodospira trueperi]|uniref:PAS domain-containing protein n=1 Tax=Rhodospira trueperi TaxID=69960 RepID=A0A1G6XQ54_9PROT|nr:response regulator [Rhodospira trueperi]SDD79497.1 PAS domain-containing protein [Rhodospira trueperi]